MQHLSIISLLFEQISCSTLFPPVLRPSLPVARFAPLLIVPATKFPRWIHATFLSHSSYEGTAEGILDIIPDLCYTMPLGRGRHSGLESRTDGYC